jgi:hypothetical protein
MARIKQSTLSPSNPRPMLSTTLPFAFPWVDATKSHDLSSRGQIGRSILSISNIYVSSQSCNLILRNAAIFVTIKSESGGRNQLSNKLGTTLSIGLNPAVTSGTRNRLFPTSHLLHLQVFSHRLSPHYAVAGLCMCLVMFTEHLGLFWGYFRLFTSANMHTVFHPSYRSISPRLLRFIITSPGSLGAYYTSSSTITSLILCLFIALYCTYL